MAENIIEIKLKSFSYHQKALLKDINLNIKRGEFILLTGLSGCGKTTLIRIMNGLIPYHYEGDLDAEVRIAGKRVKDYKKGELAKVIGNVFQTPKDQFFSTLAEDEVALVGENLGMDRELLKERVKKAFEILGIEYLKNANIFEMSGGEMQKVAIASSLIYDNDILLLDEPSASLDYKSTLELANILNKLKSMGKTIVIAEHRLFYLKDLFDKMIILNNGRIEREFKPGELNEKILKENNLRCLDENVLFSKRDSINGETKIEVRDLDIKIKKKTLIKNISFDLKDKECMGVIGGNGVGKTTLIKILSGLMNTRFEYINFGRSKRERLKNSYLLLQDADSQIFFHTVENEIVEKNKMNNKEHLKEVKSELMNADLWEKRLEHPQELSTGEKQRLSLMIAYLKEKELILLDEPSSGLDYRRMKFASDMIVKKTENTPIILVTHDLELLFNTANTVMMLTKNGYEKIDIKGNEKRILEFLINSR